MKQWIALAVGGFLGVFARYFSSGWLQKICGLQFPLGTLFVNLAGCFFAGWVSARAGGRWAQDPVVRAFFVAGFCGAFTTLSTLILEADAMESSGQAARALIYLLFSVCAGWLLFRAGIRIGASV